MRAATLFMLCAFLLLGASCSKRKPTDPNAEEWNDIQALADDATPKPADSKPTPENTAVIGEPLSDGEFDGFIQRLEAMKDVQRQPGETLLTGKTLVFDYTQHVVRLDEKVVVIDDHGRLETESLTGRFSASNTVRYIEAKGGVAMTSDGREAHAETGVYDYANGMVQLEGLAKVSEGENRLSGERIRFWVRGERKMVCEPNALLEISGAYDGEGNGLPAAGPLDAELRADTVVYDASRHVAELKGNVRLRDPRMAMNCGEAHIVLKDDSKIDWIEALSEVIIKTEDRKALAERATYDADEGKFTLEGNPKVMQGRSVMTGDRIIFWHETRGMVCEPNARVLLYMDEETRAKFLKDLND